MQDIRHSVFMAYGGHVVYGLDAEPGFNPRDDEMIIDTVYDGVCIKDPHSTNKMIFVADYPSQPERGRWYGFFVPPQYTKYSAPGVHTVEIKVAPRKIAQAIRTRDFSEAAGGRTAKFQFRILPDYSTQG